MSTSPNKEKKCITAVELKQIGIGSNIYYLYPCQMWETECGECLKDDKTHFHVYKYEGIKCMKCGEGWCINTHGKDHQCKS